MTIRYIAAATLLATSLTAVQAATQQFESSILPNTVTDWSSFADLQQFNPSLGTLQSVLLELSANLTATAQVESHNKGASGIAVNIAASLELFRSDNKTITLLQVMPSLTRTFDLATYDGHHDYAGSSGTTLTDLAATATGQASFLDPSTLALFTGTGTLQLPVEASSESSLNGPANLVWELETVAGGLAKVTYTYLPSPSPVPEPGSWMLLAAGLLTLGWLRTRRTA